MAAAKNESTVLPPQGLPETDCVKKVKVTPQTMAEKLWAFSMIRTLNLGSFEPLSYPTWVQSCYFYTNYLGDRNDYCGPVHGN